MDVLIRQIAQIIENNEAIDHNAAMCRALREVILSGMSRCGFLKECPYLSGLDRYEDHILYLSFLNQNKDGLEIQEYLSALNNELYAAGISGALKEIGKGFTVEFDGAKAVVFVCEKDYGLETVYAYQQQPLAYELRSVVKMTEGVRAEIEKALEKSFMTEKKTDDKKKSASKSGSKNKKKSNTDQWMQPSLFDF